MTSRFIPASVPDLAPDVQEIGRKWAELCGKVGGFLAVPYDSQHLYDAVHNAVRKRYPR